MTQQELSAINEIEGTGGFLAIQRLTEKKIAELNSVETINENNAAVEALGKKYAIKILKDFLYDIRILSKPITKKDNTHE